MNVPATYLNFLALRRKVVVTGTIHFTTAWRIGSGREGEISDLGVMLSPDGEPILPGSSLKGVLRTTCERLAHAFGFSSCQLDSRSTDTTCASDVEGFRRRVPQQEREQYAALNSADRLKWIEDHTCRVCRLFGSPLRRAVLRVSDGRLKDWPGVVQVRDSVVIDRDSRTAAAGLKFDFDVVPSGTMFEVQLDLENPDTGDLALLGAALFEWAAGTSLGGFTSRGLGRAQFQDIKVAEADLEDRQQRYRYLTNIDPQERLTPIEDWKQYFGDLIQRQLDAATTPG